MQRVAYRVFYDYKSMLRCSPLHNKLSSEEVKSNIAALPNELETILGDKESTVSLQKSIKDDFLVFVNSEHNEETIDSLVAKALSSLSLFGVKLESTSEIVVK